MYLPVLQAISTSEIYISGDVTIDSTAVISPGVILQAAPGSKIIIRAGVCIGLGAILKAYGGKIEVKENAILGAGVLVIGESKINSQVCVGTSTTIYNTSLDSMSIIPAGSVIGDPSRPKDTSSTHNQNLVTKSYDQDQYIKEENATTSTLNNGVIITPEIKEETTLNDENDEIFATETTEINSKFEQDLPVTTPDKNTATEDPWENVSKNSPSNPIVGKVYINKLLVTLFPEKQLKDN